MYFFEILNRYDNQPRFYGHVKSKKALISVLVPEFIKIFDEFEWYYGDVGKWINEYCPVGKKKNLETIVQTFNRTFLQDYQVRIRKIGKADTTTTDLDAFLTERLEMMRDECRRCNKEEPDF